jgi:ABC-2 type transport system permease protein
MLIQSVKKEAIIIANDLHSLAVLFLLPITFMVIMTFAMGESQQNLIRKINIQLAENSQSTYHNALSLYLIGHGFRVNQQDKFDASLTIEQGFDQTILTQRGNGKVSLVFSDELSPQTQLMIVNLVKATLSKLKLHAYMQDMGDFEQDLSLEDKVKIVEANASVDYLLSQQKQPQIFTAPTLYSIPSWLIFGIYFIVLPISTTLIKEKQNGTLLRIQTYPISTQYYLFNKALSYSFVSLFQWALLCIVGIFFVPWLTEQAFLQINNFTLFFTSAIFIIFSAIAFAFLLASLVSTFEQAIVLGGGINILLAAFSGFMVPIDIMPDILAEIATYSPMYWSAELVKQSLAGDSLVAATSNLLKLLIFACISFSGALYIFNIKRRNISWT